MSITRALSAAGAMVAAVAGSVGALVVRDNPACPYEIAAAVAASCSGTCCEPRIAPDCANHSEQNKISCHFGDVSDGLRHVGIDPYAPADPSANPAATGPGDSNGC